MPAIVSSVLTKVQDKLPNQIGDNKHWSTSFVQAIALAAAHAADERIGMTWVQDEISLTDDTAEYDLDSSLISVETVEFALDGSTYNQHLLPVLYSDLDQLSRTWRDDRGTLPEYYALLSTPGSQIVNTVYGAKIIIYRPLTTAGSATIRVGGWGIGTASTDVADSVMDQVHVPYVMAVLRAEHDVNEAGMWYQRFKDGCDRMKGKRVSPYAQQPVRLGGWR